jgi:Short C-terminal domain
MRFKGYGSEATISAESIEIVANGLGRGALGAGQRVIRFSDIIALSFTPAKGMTNGRISVGTARGLTQLHFLKKQSPDAEAFYAALQARSPHAGTAAMPTRLQSDVVDRLKQRQAVAADNAAERHEEAADRRQQLEDRQSELRAEIAERRTQAELAAQEKQLEHAARVTGDREFWAGTQFLGATVNRPTLVKIKEQSSGTAPWLVISSLAAGALAAWEDRIMILKVGSATGFMAGSIGGGRTATFYLADINAIEYNSGLLNGVLEVLTASYQGSANKDFWRGRLDSRNADAHDPFTQSNTLPLDRATHAQATPALNRLRGMIADAKSGRIAARPVEPLPDLPGQLARLASLRDAGVLTDEEFAAAKARLISG